MPIENSYHIDWGTALRKRFYIMLVARNSEGQLLRTPIPLHYLYTFIAGTLIGMLIIIGMSGSVARMVRTDHAWKSHQVTVGQVGYLNQFQSELLNSSLPTEILTLHDLRVWPRFQFPSIVRLRPFSPLKHDWLRIHGPRPPRPLPKRLMNCVPAGRRACSQSLAA